jgi:hypothetical protein
MAPASFPACLEDRDNMQKVRLPERKTEYIAGHLMILLLGKTQKFLGICENAG